MQGYLAKALIILFGLCLICFLWAGVSSLAFPYMVDYGEAPIINQSNSIISKQSIYKSDFSEPPYTVSNYPPVYPLIIAGISRYTGLSPLFTARLISFLASIASGVILASISRSITSSFLAAMTTLGIFLGHPYIFSWSTLARVDILALFFSLLAIFILYHHWQSWGWLAFAAICLIASIFTRQSYILAGPFAAISWLWFRDRHRALLFALSLGSVLIAIFLVINIYTQGGFFQNIVRANINSYQLTILGDWIRQLISIWPIVIVGTFAFIAFHLSRHIRQIEPSRNPFIIRGLLVYTLFSVITAVTIGKVGSGVNYFFEMIAAFSILSSLALHTVYRMNQSLIKTFIYSLVFIQLIWLLAGSILVNREIYKNTWKHLDWYHTLNEKVEVAIQRGQVLSDDYMGLIVNNGQSIYYQPFEYGQLYDSGLWEPHQLVNEIRARRFSLILIGGSTLNKPCCWPPEVVEAIQDSYQIDYQPDIIFCVPKR